MNKRKLSKLCFTFDAVVEFLRRLKGLILNYQAKCLSDILQTCFFYKGQSSQEKNLSGHTTDYYLFVCCSNKQADIRLKY